MTVETNVKTASASLVSSADVDGTKVYSKDGRQIGHIDHLMIDKVSGNVAYAIMGFGGFLGMGEDHQPIPWQSLHYDTTRHGYTTDIDEDLVKAAPEPWDGWHRDRKWEQRTLDHYRVPYYWM